MNPFLDNLLKLGTTFGALPPGRRMTILVAGLATFLAIGSMVYFANQVEYGILFSGLSSEDASSVVAKLQERKIPYKISPGGNTIYAPADSVPELRLELAAGGAIRGGNVGFEIFDNKTLGATEFEQQLNFRRALQGELSRTINSLDEVAQSRVHIAFPKESLFADQQRKATASVTVRLKSGRSLRPTQIDGITHLVASSVEGLNAEDVMVLDGKGNILSKVAQDGKGSRLSSTQAEYQRNLEKEMATQIQTMLEKVVGKGKAAVRVTADLDFRVTERTEETYDPESPVIRSTSRQTDKSTPSAKNSTGGLDKEKQDEVVNYEINKVVNRTLMPVGEVRKLSIAVLVDGIATKNDKGQETYAERPKKDLEALEDLVRKSAGFNATRGDQVAVTSMPFIRMEDAALAESSWMDKLTPFIPFAKYAALAAAFVLVFFLAVKPLISGILAAGLSVAASAPMRVMTMEKGPMALSGEGAALMAPQRSAEAATEEDLVRQLAGADAKRFAELLRNWVK